MENTSESDFRTLRKVIYENVEKKTFILQQTYLYIWVADILKFYKFYSVHFVKVCFVFKKQSLCLSSSYMHKTFSVLGKWKIAISWKIIGWVDFLPATKNLKMFYFTRPTGRDDQKVRLHHWYIYIYIYIYLILYICRRT